MVLHSYAVEIEHIVRRFLSCDRFGFGGIANADFIEYGGMITAISAALSTKYYENNKEKIDEFLEDITYYNGMDMNEIGEIKIKEIIENLRELDENIKY